MRTPVHEPPLQEVFQLAEELGCEIHLVGGSVRDLLLAIPCHDLDFVVRDGALRLARECADRLGGSLVPLDDERDIVRVVLRGGTQLDFARLAEDDLEQDLRRRDFTVNAMAIGRSGKLLDPLGGAADLRERRLRLCSPSAFRDDPLRLLRAVRLLAAYGFTAAPDLVRGLEEERSLLGSVAGERIRDEWFALLRAGISSQLELLLETGLLFAVLPELEACRAVEQNHFHHLDVLAHTLQVVRHLESLELEALHPRVRQYLDSSLTAGRSRLLLLKLAAFLRDTGKPACRQRAADGRIHFLGHEQLGAERVEEIARRLVLSRRESRYLERIVRLHLEPVLLHFREDDPAGLYRFFARSGREAPDLLVLSCADVCASRGPAQSEAWLARHRRFVIAMLDEFFSQGRLAHPRVPVSGSDLQQELGISPGPEVGRLLGCLEEAAAVGRIKTRDEALALARKILGRE